MNTSIYSNNRIVDSLLEKASLHSNPTENLALAQLNTQIGLEYYNDDNFQEALKYLELAFQNRNWKKDEETYFKLLLGLGRSHERLNNYEEAVALFFKIIESQNPAPPNLIKANSYSHLGTTYKALGEYEKAYEYQLKALQFHELEKDSNGIGRVQYDIGSILFYQNRFEQALEYYQKAHAYFIQIENQKLIYASLAAMGSCYTELKNYSASLEFGERALNIANDLDYKTGIAYSLGNVARVKFQLGEMEEAKKMLLKSLQLKKELKDNWAIIGGHLGLAEILIKCKTPRKAIPHLEEALLLSQKIDSKTRLMETYQYFEATYEALGDFPKAHFYLKKFTLLRDSVLNEKTVAEMGQAKRRFEMEKKENEIALLQYKNEVLTEKKKNQFLRNSLFMGLGLLLLIGFVFNSKRLGKQQKTNSILIQQKEKIESQNHKLQNAQKQLVNANKLLADKNNQLETSNDDLKNFAYVASHDLKEPLRMIHSYTSLLKRKYNDVFDDSGKEFMFFVTDAVKRMDALLDGLLNYSRVDTQGQLDKLVDTQDVLIMVQSNLTQRLAEENAQLIINNENLPTLKSNQVQLIQLFQNLISNAIKFRGERTPVVTIDCKTQNGEHIFSIQDNGIGIAKENQKKVFEMFKRLHTREEYEGTGIGLSTCKKIVQNHGGEIWLESEEGVGTTFYFSFPVTVEEMFEVEVEV